MATQTIRQNGQLVETELDSTQLAKLQGQPVAPASPSAAAANGATPDQSKMAGTANQLKGQQTVLQDNTKPADTLTAAKRTDAPRQQATGAEQSAEVKAAKLHTLGSLSTRVESMIEKEFQLKNAATAAVDQTQLGTVKPEAQVELKAALDEVMKNPTDPEALARATQAWVDNGLGTVQDFNPQSFVSKAQDSLGQAAGAQIRDTVTLENLELSPEEQEGLTSVFGDTWKGLTVPQLQAKLEELRQAEYSRVEGLKAELATATPGTPQYELLLRELQDLGQVGVTGTEKGVQDLQAQVAAADTITIDGTDYTVENLLKDKTINEIVVRMLNDPEYAARLKKGPYAEFVNWVEQNKASLEGLAKTLGDTQGQVRTAHEATQELAKVGDITLDDDVMKALFPDWGKVTGAVPDASKVAVLNRLKGLYAEDPKAAKEFATALQTTAEQDPALMRKVAGLSEADLQAAFGFAQAFDDDQTGLLQELTGLDRAPFVVDEADQQKIVKAKAVTDAIVASGLSADVYQSDAFKNLAKSGEIGVEQVQKLARYPERWDAYVQYEKNFKAIEVAREDGNIDGLLDIMFGRDVDVAALNQEYALLQRYAAVDPTFARQLQSYQSTLDLNRDNVIDYKDAGNVADQLLKATNTSWPPSTGKMGFSALLDSPPRVEPGSVSTPTLAAGLGQMGVGTGGVAQRLEQSSSLFDQISAAMSDGRISTEEIDAIGQDPSGKGLDILFSAPGAQKALGGVTREQYETALRGRKEVEAARQGERDAAALAANYFGKPEAVDEILSRFGNDSYVFSTEDEEWVRRALTELDQKIRTTPGKYGNGASFMRAKLQSIIDANERNKVLTANKQTAAAKKAAEDKAKADADRRKKYGAKAY